jgi:hypothetical protein
MVSSLKKGKQQMLAEMTATVDNGILRPDAAIPFPDQTRVKITIETLDAATDSTAAWEAIKARLGLRPIHSGGKRFTRDELHERR